MKTSFRLYIISLLLLFSPGCEKNVDNVPLPEFKQKLVIASFLSPSDSISYFYVSSNKRIFGDLSTIESTGNLSGTISDGVSEVPLDTFRAGLKLDHKKMQIRYDGNYSIKISSDKGLSAEGTCKVPGKRNFVIETDTFSIPIDNFWERNSRRIDMRISIQDIPGEENYYRIDYSASGSRSNPNKGPDPELMRLRNGFSDQGLDGQKITVRTNMGLNFFFECDSAFMKIYLYNTEKSYYLYHKSLWEYSDGNPFSEATPVYSNIKGGLGIFAGYTIDSLIVRLK